MTLTLQPIRVATGFDEEGMMVLDRQRLVAGLVRLVDDNEVAPGHWYLEAAYGRIDGTSHPTFASLDSAQEWIARRLASHV